MLVEPVPSRVGRDGLLRVAVARRGGRMVVTGCRSTLPLQVLAPVALDDPAAIVSVLNPTGGLVGGDRLTIEVTVEEGAHALLTTPSATKVYRTRGDPAIQTVALRVGSDATLEWLPDHTIPFADSAFRQTVDVDVAEGGRLILADGFAAGRISRGEAWSFQRLESALRLRDRGGWLLLDRFSLEGGAGWNGLGFTELHPYFATLVIVADGAERVLADRLSRLAPGDARTAVAALPRRGVIVRCLAATAPALTETIAAVWRMARPIVVGLAPPALRKL